MAMSMSPAQLSSFLAAPAATPPPGQVANFDNPSTLHAYNLAILIIVLTLTTSAIIVRLFSRWYLARQYAPEDFLIIVGWAFQCAQIGIPFYVMETGYDHHRWDITTGQLLHGQKFIYWTAITYGPTILAVKVSLLLQYIHLFAPSRSHNPFLYFASWSWIAVLTVFYLINFIMVILQCLPVRKSWDPFVKGHCLNTIGLYGSTGVINVISDFVILLIPLPTIYKLRVPMRKKIAIGSLFATGALACIASILRTYYTWKILKAYDTTWWFDVMGTISWMEIAIGILVFCLPVAPRFLKFTQEKVTSLYMKTLISKTSRSMSGSNSTRDQKTSPANKGATKDIHPIDVSDLSSMEMAEIAEQTHARHHGHSDSSYDTDKSDGRDSTSMTQKHESYGPV